MLMYLLESILPENGETRFCRKDNAFITADKSYRSVSQFALSYGFLMQYVVETRISIVPGDNKLVI